MDSPPSSSSSSSNDIFSLSDQVLANRLQFIEEIGFGNWGSVWLCRPKSDPASKSSPTKYKHVKIAVKLVHRSKTQTTAARVRSLWNEMKVVRSLKSESHPSIVPFYSFIITPSYALITMAFLPRLVPVEVDEKLAKQWFQSLLSGVEFLHTRGVVHNDIKPANILLSEEDVPVLVDFGFAEKYEQDSSNAFKSNLAYGTPEYLSPERARGLYHDTRKSDVWSLGVTFFEILVGRTPFEYVEGEQFSTKEDLEKYWARTLRGKWVGSWKMSRGVEKMLRRMIAPNADVRCTATEAVEDPYWSSKEVTRAAHRKSASLSQAAFSAMSIDMDTSKFLDIVSPFTTRTLKDKKEEKSHNKENMVSPSSRNVSVRTPKQGSVSAVASRAKHVRSQSQSKVPLSPAQTQASGLDSKTQSLKPLVFAPMAPIKGSTTSSNCITPSTPMSAPKATSIAGKENSTASSSKKLVRVPSEVRTKKPVGPRKAPASPVRPKKVSSSRGNRENDENAGLPRPSAVSRPGRVLMDLSMNSNVENSMNTSGVSSHVGKSSVRDRWMDWERERERLREMDRSQERMKEAEEEREKEKVWKDEERKKAKIREEEEREREAALEEELKREREIQREKEIQEQRRKLEEELMLIQTQSRVTSPSPPEPMDQEAQSGMRNGLPLPKALGSGLSSLKQSVMTSIERGVQMYKTSTSLAYIGKQSTKLFSDADESRRDTSERRSWEDGSLVPQANSSSPAVRNAVGNDRSTHETQEDRMNIWIKNVEKVVEDARKGFATAPPPVQPASLPAAPPRRPSQRGGRRVPRKILAASQIFSEDGSSVADKANNQSQSLSADVSVAPADRSLSKIASDRMNELPASPKRTRRATVMGLSPSGKNKSNLEVETTGSPSKNKRQEKSKSQSNLLEQPITPLRKLEMELERLAAPNPPLRLSAVVDASLFIASPASSKKTSSMEVNDLEASPCHVEPYPARTITGARSLDSPNTRRRVESRYEQMVTTTGVKKVGLGYESEDRCAIGHIASPNLLASTASKKNTTFFHSTRRAMPPPVSSEDWRKTVSVDELGMTPAKAEQGSKEDRNGTSSVVRRAFDIMTGKTHSRRQSRIG